ncbi:chemotaxis-specific protein-glutamate methyltransferase CheB [Marinilactibacillus kalidii]|uniref:chemotaxis-specific protein-glutamate methyltransferase CheB n=1 Tax=Marinilactibacillus kalidii TaxID=2820274 RepID=UPI001ABED5A3|nr:chemotaxis-specific protein-glutamate methyltransferase CheB [Marinilactibacillus kalidii]
MSIKIMVIDDSAFMRRIMSHTLQEFEGVAVHSLVSCGKDAVAKLKSPLPDLITIDAQVADLTETGDLKKLIQKNNIPAIMISSSDSKKETTMKALEVGAVDFLLRPQELNKDWTVFQEMLEKKIRLFVKSKTKPIERVSTVRKATNHQFTMPVEAIVIGASTGGPKALVEVVRELPAKIGIPIFIVQHMPKGFTTSFAKRLDALSGLTIVEAEDGQRIQKDTVYLAPGGKHMLIDKDRILLTEEDKIHGVRPAVDYLFETAAIKYGHHLVGVVLTGMGNDGAIGSKAIKESGGYMITQNQETSVIYGMPRNVEEKGYSDNVASLYDIGNILKNMIG